MGIPSMRTVAVEAATDVDHSRNAIQTTGVTAVGPSGSLLWALGAMVSSAKAGGR